MIDRRPVTAALHALLATLTGKPVGVRTVPIDPATGQPYPPPYTLLYPLDQDDADNTLAGNHKAAIATYQATFVSGPTPGKPDSRGTDEQAQWLADKARRVVERAPNGGPGYLHPLTIPGVNCWYLEMYIKTYLHIRYSVSCP